MKYGNLLSEVYTNARVNNETTVLSIRQNNDKIIKRWTSVFLDVIIL